METNQRILILYAAETVSVGTVADHLYAFAEHSRYEVHYVHAVRGVRAALDLELFDAVFLHYSVRLVFPDYLSPEFASKLRSYTGPKILFIQDEYEDTDRAIDWIQKLDIQTVFTCVPDEFIENVYPAKRLPGVRFISNLTGYVSEGLIRLDVPPIGERPVWVGYRGRALHPAYGRLGWEKRFIGEEFKRRARGRIPIDIETGEERRIYGAAWPRFIMSCRAVLATESGSNVFDFDGEIRRRIDERLKTNPDMSFAEIERLELQGEEKRFADMGQVSPRVFEAVSLKTALVAFPGRYSGVLEADRHYIPLAKDFSNFEDVLSRLADVDALADMVENAHADIVRSSRFSYRKFIERVDSVLAELLRPSEFKASILQIDFIGASLANPPTSLPLTVATLESIRREPMDLDSITFAQALARIWRIVRNKLGRLMPF